MALAVAGAIPAAAAAQERGLAAAAARRDGVVGGGAGGATAAAPVRLGAGLGTPLVLAQAVPPLGAGEATALPEVAVTARRARPTATIGQPPAPYAGGQVASGQRVGPLGNRGVFETPFSVTTFTEQLIRDQQSRTLSDVLRNDPSIQLNQTANPTGTDDVFNVRGFLLGSFATLYDGLPGLNFRTPAIELIERVEVFRGPTALVNGNTGGQGIGGTVNLVPKRAPDAPLTRLTGRYVSDSIFGVHADVARRYGPGGAAGVRVNLVRREGATAVDEVDKATTVLGFAGDLRLDRVRLSLDLDYQDDENGAYGGAVTVAPGLAVPPSPSGRAFLRQRWARLDQEKVRAVGRAEFDLAPDWTLGVAYGRRSVNERFNGSDPQVVNAAGDTRQGSTNGASYALAETADATVRGVAVTGPVRHRVFFGANQNETESRGRFAGGPTTFSNLYRPAYVPRPAGFEPTPSVPGTTSRSATRSVFAGDELGFLGDRLLLTLGLRQIEIYDRSFSADTGAQTSRYRDSALSPAAGVVAKPLEWLSLYANYIEGLESGGVAPSNAANAGQGLAPLTAEAYEAGVKADFGTFGATLGVFRIERQNAFLDVGTNLFGPNGRQVNQGVELYGFGEPLPGVRLIGGVTLLDSEARRTQRGLFDGNRPIGQPETTVRAYAEWDTPLARGLTLTGGVAHTSRQFVDLANTQSIPAWTRVDLGARYAFEVNRTPLVARFAVENAADRNYWATVDRGFLFVSAPRTYLFSLTADF